MSLIIVVVTPLLPESNTLEPSIILWNDYMDSAVSVQAVRMNFWCNQSVQDIRSKELSWNVKFSATDVQQL